MTDKKDIWVFIEQTDGQIAEVSLELLAKANELAQTLDSEVWGLLCGHQIGDLAEKVIHYGAHKVLVADHRELELYRTLPYCRVAVDLIQQYQPNIFLIGATPVGRDLAPGWPVRFKLVSLLIAPTCKLAIMSTAKRRKFTKICFCKSARRLAAISLPQSLIQKRSPRWRPSAKA